MTENRFKLIVRWVIPPIVTSLAFAVVFVGNAIKQMLGGIDFTIEFLYALLITIIAGAVGGLAYSIYRPVFRKLGRHMGDLLTGAITMDLYFLTIYNLLQYNEFDQGLANGLTGLIIFATLIGAFTGWYLNITKIEFELIQFFSNQLIKEHSKNNRK